MQKISADTILSELILQNPFLLPVMYFTGLYSDFDGKTVRQVSKEKGINESYLLNILQICTDDGFMPSETLPSYSVLQLTALSSAIYPFFLNQLDLIIHELLKLQNFQQDKKRPLRDSLKDLFDGYKQLLADRYEKQKETVLPHVSTVYELYYSPDYTSERSDLMNYSLDFYDGKIAQLQETFKKIKALLEQVLAISRVDLQYVIKVHHFYQLNRDIQVHDRIERKMLKPLVLEMEESIITTFRKKNKTFRRNNYLSLPTGTPPSDVLSPREKEVLQLVAQGFINKEIAEKLEIGLTTVITHRKNIVEKLGIRSIPGLTVYAYTQGYLDDSILINED